MRKPGYGKLREEAEALYRARLLSGSHDKAAIVRLIAARGPNEATVYRWLSGVPHPHRTNFARFLAAVDLMLSAAELAFANAHPASQSADVASV